MERLTVAQFNKKYGVTTYGFQRYTIAEEKDIGTFVRMVKDGVTIPYFCKWEQQKEPFTDSDDKYTNYVEIVEGV